MDPGKYSTSEIKSGNALVKNQPKKAVKSEQNLAYEEPQPTPKATSKSKKPRSEKQRANDKRLGEAAKARAKKPPSEKK